ncbi:MAG: twitching motility protein PilT [Elusimicrobia bacterium RBG_16_66_12]|nr:MAG: twitching motility protein PilT [Elusimicrobia bacterium RBG_16_66_12]
MIFIDTGAFLARYVAEDRLHAVAVAGWDRLGQERAAAFTSNLVLSETFTLLARRAGYAFAAERARHILDSGALTILRPGERQDREALMLFEKFADQGVSFTDCVSFALMRHHHIKRAFAFDRHFTLAGFDPWPDPR